MSNVIAGPVTFGSTILLPPQCFDWDLRKRQAVLAHEGAHVANRDFYVLLLASLNRSVFWFSPFAWWHLTRLAELAEIISDARALEVVEDRLSYAEILLDLAQHVRRAPAGIEMARACTVRAGWNAFSRPPRTLRSWAGASESGPPPSSCRLSSFLPAPSPTARASADACDRRRGRRGDGRAQAGAGRLLFIGPSIDLHHLSGRRRAVRPSQRAAKAPPGCGGRWHLFLPGGGRPDSWAVGVSNNRRPSGAEPERPRNAGHQGRRIVVAKRRGRCGPAGFICRLVCVVADPRADSHPRRRTAPCAGERTAEVRNRGARRRCLCRHGRRSRYFPARWSRPR